MLFIMQDNSVYCYGQRQPIQRTVNRVIDKATHKARQIRTRHQCNRKNKT